jgi:hypothetical protein
LNLAHWQKFVTVGTFFCKHEYEQFKERDTYVHHGGLVVHGYTQLLREINSGECNPIQILAK